MTTEPQQARSVPLAVRVLFGRHVLSERITSATLLAGILIGALVGLIAFNTWLPGFWIGVVCGLVIPRLALALLALGGELPGWAIYKPRGR